MAAGGLVRRWREREREKGSVLLEDTQDGNGYGGDDGGDGDEDPSVMNNTVAPATY